MDGAVIFDVKEEAEREHRGALSFAADIPFCRFRPILSFTSYLVVSSFSYLVVLSFWKHHFLLVVLFILHKT